VAAADEGEDGEATDGEGGDGDGSEVNLELSAAEKAAKKQAHAAICSGKHDGVKLESSRSFNPNFDEPVLGIDADVQASLDRDPMPTAIPTGGNIYIIITVYMEVRTGAAVVRPQHLCSVLQYIQS
jgi:hypothetical protein